MTIDRNGRTARGDRHGCVDSRVTSDESGNDSFVGDGCRSRRGAVRPES
jgi:hypothetical protein